MQEAVIRGDHEALQRLLQRQGCQAAHGIFDGVELALHVGAHVGEVLVGVALTGVVDAGAGDHHRTSTGQLLEQHGLLAANQLHQRDHYGGGHPLLQVGEALGLVIAPAHRHPVHHGAGAAGDIGHRKTAFRAGQQGGHANGRD